MLRANRHRSLSPTIKHTITARIPAPIHLLLQRYSLALLKQALQSLAKPSAPLLHDDKYERASD